MNKDKVGKPFHYPNTFLFILGSAKSYFHLPYRQTEGIAQGHAKGKFPCVLDYTTMNRRINRLDVNIKDDSSNNKEPKENYFLITIDNTSIKVTNRGQRSRDKYNIKKRYFKNSYSNQYQEQENQFNEGNR